MGKKKAIILSRVSTETQELISQTEKVKQEVLRDYNEDQIIVIENKESAVTKSEEELLGINEMKLFIETDNISCVYCYELSRLSRRPKVLYSLRDYFLEHKVQLVVLNPYFRLLEDDGKLNQSSNIIFALYSSFAETEARQLKERCMRGRMKNRSEGKFIGGKVLFGYSINKSKNYIINKEEADVVRQIFQLYASGVSKLSIAKMFRSRGFFLNFQSAIDCHTHIDNILHNRDYTGQRGKPRIISDELFDIVQDKFPNATKRHATKRLALGRSFLFNPKCTINRKLYYVNTKINSYFSYYGSEKEHPYFIKVDIVDKLIWYMVKKHYNRLVSVFPSISPMPEIEQITIDKNESIINDKIDSLYNEIEDLKQSIQKIEERLIYGRLTDEKANELQSQIDIQIKNREIQINEFKKSIEEIPEVVLSGNIDEWSMDMKCSLVRKIFFDIHMWRGDKFYWYMDFYLDSETVERYKIYSKHRKYYFWNNEEWVSLEI